MIHFAYPNTNTRHKETIFIGCGRFIAATEPPSAEYHDAAPKMTHSLEILFEAASHFAPEALENHARVYEKQDRPEQSYQGNSMSLAYLCALISRARRLALPDWRGDIWCTGEIHRQYGEETRFLLRPVAHDGFQKKLDAFLAPENPDRLLIAPFANIGAEYGACSQKLAVLRVGKGRQIAPEQLQAGKTLLLIDEMALEQLFDLLFIAPAAPPKTASTRLHKPRTYIPHPTFNYFVGRTAELQQIVDELHSDKKYTIIVNAMGGIGKTVLASHVVETLKAEFAGVYYKKCTPDTDADELLAELAYFLAERGDSTLAEVFEYAAQQEPKLNALVAALNARRYLLLFDDMHDLLNKQTSEIIRPDVQRFFEHLLTQTHQTKLLLVTRTHPALEFGMVRQSEHKLSGLDPDAGMQFLRDLEVSDDPALLRQAYDFTKGHPVSMQLLAELKRAMPLQEILADLDQFLQIPQVANRLLQSIYQTMTPDEQAAMLQIAVLPRPVTFAVIRALCERPDIRLIVSNLVRKTLVIYDDRLQNYRLHDVIRDFHRSQLTDEQRKAYHLNAAAYYERQEFNAELPTFAQVQNRLEARYHYFQAGEIEKAAQLLLDIAEFYRIWGYLQQCKTLIQETLKRLESLAQAIKEQELMIDLLVELSWVKRSVSSFDKAVEYCKRAESLLDKVTNQKHAGNVYHALGRFLYEQGYWDQAEIYFNQSFEIRKQVGDTKGLAKILRELYELYWGCGEIEKLETITSEGIKICKESGDTESQAEILVNILGNLSEDQDKYDEALSVFEESLVLRKVDNSQGRSLSLRCIGRILRKKKSFQNALKEYEKSFTLAQKARDVIAQSYILIDIGDTYRDDGRIEDAIKNYEEAIKFAKTSDDLANKANIFRHIAWSYQRTSKFDEALKQFQQFWQLSDELGDIIWVSDALNGMGRIYMVNYSNMEKALQCFRESIKIREKIGRLLTIGTELCNIAFIFIEQGRFDEALNILKELKVKEKRWLIPIIHNFNYTGIIYRLQGKVDEAFKIHKESLRIVEKTKRNTSPVILNYLGEDYLAIGDYVNALLCLNESVKLQSLFFLKAQPLTNIADIYFRQGKLAEAMATCEESLALSRTYGGRIQAGVTLHLMAKIRQQEGRPADALPYIQEAVAIFRDTGSRHLAEAEKTLQTIQNAMTQMSQ